MDRPTTKEVARFFDKVQITKHCWLWIGSLVSNGYGHFWFRGKTVYSHRFSYELFVEPIEPGKHILHRRGCGNRNCLNPHHLYMGTNDDNIKDRDTWGNPAVGEKQARSKLSEFDVITIRKIYNGSNKTFYNDVAKIFSVHPNTIRSIIIGRTWKHL